jgi:hypothetical protein
MNVRRPQTTSPTNRLFTASTAGWYATWKARRVTPEPVPATEPAPVPERDALAKGLVGEAGK